MGTAIQTSTRIWKPNCDWIAERIKDGIRTGEYPPGSRLPPERSLAELLGVNRTSLREALRSLVSAGLLHTERSAGTWVAKNAMEQIADTMSLTMLLDASAMRDFLNLYELISVHIAELAAMRRTESDLALLREEIQAMATHPHGTRENSQAHSRFNRGVAAAAHCPVSETTWQSVNDIKRNVDRATGRDPRVDKTRWQMVNEVHERLLEALERRDVIEARRAMAMDMAIVAEYWNFVRDQLLSSDRLGEKNGETARSAPLS